MELILKVQSLSFKVESNLSFFGALNEALCILVTQETEKLPEVKFRDTKRNPGLEPRPRTHGADWAQ